MDQTDSDNSKRPTGLIIGAIAIVTILILVGLFLPPVSLGERLGLNSNEPAAAGTETVTEQDTDLDAEAEPVKQTAVADGVALSLSEGQATISLVPQDEFLADQEAALPEQASLVSDVFVVEHEEEPVSGQVALPLPAGAGDYRTLDL